MDLKKYTDQEIAEAMLVAAKLSLKKQHEADKQLAEHRDRRRAGMTENQKLHIKVLQLKTRLEDYVKGDDYNHEFTFGYFLEQYLQLTNKKKKEFANDIQIHETLLSNILKNRREPNESFMIRLEIHSDFSIPAINWFKLLEKGKAYQINTDQALRNRERLHVSHPLQLAN